MSEFSTMSIRDSSILGRKPQNTVKDGHLVRAFIQARMSSARFPGKVLAPLNGRPVIAHVISQATQIIPIDYITVATSEAESDDPLATYVQSLGVPVFRGALDSVFERFQSCLSEFPCDWFFRICADSPLLNVSLLGSMLVYAGRPDIDLVTNVQVRTFPKGHSGEMLNAATFAQIDPMELLVDEKEHVTAVYYRHPERFSILNIEAASPEQATESFAVDTLQDLERLERVLCGDKRSSLKAPTHA
jgi:spore coat polysaccharide biosynthesis protein SpsF